MGIALNPESKAIAPIAGNNSLYLGTRYDVKNTASLALQHRFIVTGTLWKFMQLDKNLQRFWAHHSDKFVLPYIDFASSATQLPISVNEKDSMIGTADLIRQKSLDQAAGLISMAESGELEKLGLDSVAITILNNIINWGGDLVTVTTDVAGREISIVDGKQIGTWDRILNFQYSSQALGHRNKSTAERMMIGEINAYCDSVYSGKGGQMVRALDSTMAIGHTKFSTVTKKCRSANKPRIASQVVYSGCQVVGVVMDTHPLAHKNTREKFVDYKIQEAKRKGLKTANALRQFNGRAGLSKAEDLVTFCKLEGIDYDLFIESNPDYEPVEVFRQAAEGGTYELVRNLMLTVAKWSELDITDMRFAYYSRPKDADILRVF